MQKNTPIGQAWKQRMHRATEVPFSDRVWKSCMGLDTVKLMVGLLWRLTMGAEHIRP